MRRLQAGEILRALVGLTLLLLPAVVEAGVWRGAGPDGGALRLLAASPSDGNQLYAAGDFYVFISPNSGKTWRQSGTFRDGHLRALWVDAADAKRLYAEASDGRLWRSDDRGLHWSDIHPGAPQSTSEKQRLSVHPTQGDRLALAQANGVWTSFDAGDTWTQVYDNSGAKICGIVVSPAASDELLGVGCADPQGRRAVYLSVDGGASWQQRTNDSGIRNGRVVPHPSDPSVFYANGFGGMVLRGSNRGTSWETVGTVPAPISNLVIDPLQPARFLAGASNRGIFQSLDGGATWTQALEPDGDVLAVTFTDGPGGLDRAFAATTQGVLRSPDGAVWQDANRALRAQIVPRLFQHPDGTLFALAADRLWRSADDGVRWSELGEPSAGDTVALAFDPVDSNLLYVGSIGRIHRSTDGGASWSTGSGINGGAVVWDLEVDPKTPQTVYAAGFVLNAQFNLQPWAVRSDDSGATWQLVNGAGQGNGNNLVRIAPSDSSILFVGGDGLERSSDGGVTWDPVLIWSSQQKTPHVSDIAFHPTDTNRVYVASTDLGVLKSTDGGVTLTASNSGLPTPTLYALVLDPADPDTLYAATPAGVYRSTNGGNSWQFFGDNYLRSLSLPVVALMLDRSDDGARLFAGTVGNSLYYRQLDGGCDSTRASRNPRDCRQ